MLDGFSLFPAMMLLILIIPSVSHGRTVEIAVEDAAAPWSDKNGYGYANDLVRAAFHAVKIDVHFKVVPYARCKTLAIEGVVPACFSASPEAGLEKHLYFSEQPLFTLYSDFFENITKPLKTRDLASIPKGTKVGVVIGYEYPHAVEELKKRGVIFMESKDEETNLKKLALGRIDTAIVNENEIKPASKLIANVSAEKLVKFAFRGAELNSYIAFSKKNPSGDSLRKSFDAGFKIIKDDGTAEKTYKHWASKLNSSLVLSF